MIRRTAALLFLLVAACSRLTPANYEKIKVGMAYEEVADILGAPSQTSEVLGVKACVWGDEKRSISVNFVAGKAVLFKAENLR